MTAPAGPLDDSLDLYCPLGPRQRHRVAIGDRTKNGKGGTCRFCGGTVARAHRGSGTWWHDWSKPGTRPDQYAEVKGLRVGVGVDRARRR